MTFRMADDADMALELVGPLEPPREIGSRHAGCSSRAIQRLLELVVDEYVVNHARAKPCFEHSPLAFRVEVGGTDAPMRTRRRARTPEVRDVDVAAALVAMVAMKRAAMFDAGVSDLDPWRVGPAFGDDAKAELEGGGSLPRHVGPLSIVDVPSSAAA